MSAGQHGIRAGGIDWSDTWSAMRRAVSAARAAHQDALEADPWRRRAARFDQRSRARDGLPAVLTDQLREADVVVDVGAGTGRHAFGFARRCRRVIAVEPSQAMRGRLAQRAREEEVDNLEIVDAAWPMSAGIEADVVFSSHVLYGVDDAAAFLSAMTAASRRLCALHLSLRAPGARLDPLWARVHGAEMPARPAALEALALLYQLGVHANLLVIEGSARPFELGADDDDLAELCRRLSLEPTGANMARVREALAALSPADARGMHVLGTTAPNVLIWWAARGEQRSPPLPVVLGFSA